MNDELFFAVMRVLGCTLMVLAFGLTVTIFLK
jgi:hypothetical protein